MVKPSRSPIWRAWLLVALALWMSVAPVARAGWSGIPAYQGPAMGEGHQSVHAVCIYLYANADPVMNFDPSGNFSLIEMQEAMTTVSVLARMALPNIMRFSVVISQRLVAMALRPLFAFAGSLPVVTQMGQRLSMFDRFQRFFITPTQSYVGVSNWLTQLFQRMGVTLQQHHVFIQQAWYRAGSPNQWYPGDAAANLGMQRLGNAGFNLLAIPDGLNRLLGQTASGTAAFATATAGTVYLAMDELWNVLSSPWQKPKPTKKT